MKDITDKLFIYLEAKRHLWNACFINVFESLYECSPLDEYEEIDKLLFSGLVLKDTNKNLFLDRDSKFGEVPFPYLKVALKKEIDKLNLMISDTTASGRSWKVVTIERDAETVFSFIEFFDWDRYSYVSYPYFRVRILKYDKKPEFVGKDALIETIHAQVFFDERAIPVRSGNS